MSEDTSSVITPTNSDNTTHETNFEMWDQIARMPFDLLSKTNEFIYIEKVMRLISKYRFDAHDEHMADPKYTVKLGALLLTVSSKSLSQIDNLQEEILRINNENHDIKKSLKSEIEKQHTESVFLRETTQKSSLGDFNNFPTSKGDPSKVDEFGLHNELTRLKDENRALLLELDNAKRVNEELRQSLQTQHSENTSLRQDDAKIHLEFKHLVSRYRRLMEKFERNQQALERYQAIDTQDVQNKDTETERLREEIKILQQENYSLMESRDRAEELCEQRESEALRDMTKLRRLTKDLIDEERSKLREATEYYMSLKNEHETNVANLIHQHSEELRVKDEEIVLLHQQLDKISSKRTKNFDDATVLTTSENEDSYNLRDSSFDKSVRQRLERENVDLAAEVEELELRIDAMEDENKSLASLIKDYERGNEGLLHLRHQLSDRTRRVEILEDENTQLRERLNYMEDSLTFTAALEELCKKVGVTDAEIKSLRSKNAAGYDEVATLKEEINVLKEEVEWLEKDRRHWMNKVRLQPLMDTKLRFELGLTTEQLKQLDALVDQMKSTKLTVNVDDPSYNEKFLKESKTQRKDTEEFYEYVKAQIESSIKRVFSDLDNGTSLESVVSSLRNAVEALKPVSVDDPSQPSSIFSLKAELESTKRQVGEFELTIKDYENVIQTLREKLAAAVDEKEALIKERDQYKDCIFSALSLSSDVVNKSAVGGIPVVYRCDEQNVQKAVTAHGDDTQWATVVLSLRDQLKTKDDLIETLNCKLSQMEGKLEEDQRQIESEKQVSQSNLRIQESLNDQIAALQVMNEELNEKNVELKKINAEVTNAMHQIENGDSRELLQKVVLLRRREAKLLSRLRKAITAEEDATVAKKRLQATIDTTFKSLQEALEGSSTGFVLPPSSAFHDHEKKQLDMLHTSLKTLLQGKLFREDSRYLLHLQQVYNKMEISGEIAMLREKDRASMRSIDALQSELDQLKLQVEVQQNADLNAQCQRTTDDRFGNKEYNAAAASRWESECIMWRQKYDLCYKRLEAKTEEVSLLEKDLDTVRREMIDIKDNVRNLLQADDSRFQTSPFSLQNGQEESKGLPKEKVETTETAPCGTEHTDQVTTPEPIMIEKLAYLERDMARLKSVNLGLLQHSLDLHSTLKALEIELETSRQEIALIRDSNNTKAVSDFVNAAVREHAALRRQSELALIQVKQLKIQLTATEANYHVVANEATSYKLSAHRLYRTYIEEIVSVVDYIRCLQRACKGSLSPHRAEIMDKRFRLILHDFNTVCEQNKSLVTKLSDKMNDVKTLEQQISFLRMEKEPGRSDSIEHQFLDARATIRSAMHQITEYEETLKFSEAKAQRVETYAKELSEEITRLESRCWGMMPFEEGSYERLLYLRDTVFAKAETPPLAIQPIEAVLPHGGTSEICKAHFSADDDDIAIREYKTAILKQKELARECAGLREELEAKSREIQSLSSSLKDLQDHTKHLENKTTLYQEQLESERNRAEEREARLRKAHEVQSEVVRKTAERNCHCLRDMVQRKDKEICQLQQQLHAERQKYAEQQLEEANRLERFHERMFTENEAMIERFKNAIHDKAELNSESQQLRSEFQGSNDSIFEQLRGLTSDNIRLKRELQDAHAVNVVLESQLNQQNQELQDIAQRMDSAGSKGYSSTLNADVNANDRVLQSQSSGQPPVAPSLSASSARPIASSTMKGTDILTGIINNQGTMIESLRQREAVLTGELEREKELRNKADIALHKIQAHQIEQEGTLRLATQLSTATSDSALVHELRSNIVYLEQELRNAKEALDQEKILSNRLQLDVEDWRKHLESLRLEVDHQHVEVERSEHFAALNQALQNDLGVVKEQNEKLMTAVSLLKEKLMAEARRGTESTRQHHQELALARRMGVIQNESMEHIRILDHRIKTIQQELDERVNKEKEVLTRHEDTQRMVYQLHQNLRHKEAELVDLKRQLHRLQTENDRHAVDRRSSRETRSKPLFQEKGTQVLATAVDLGSGTPAPYPCSTITAQTSIVDTTAASSAAADPTPLSRPDDREIVHQKSIVSSIARKASKMELANLHCISELRSQLVRTEKDLAAAREHLKAAQENNRELRQQLRSHEKDMEELVKRHTCEVAQLRSLLVSSRHASENKRDTRLVADLPQRIATPKPISPSEDKTDLVESKDIHYQEQQQCDAAVVDELRRKLQVDVPARENTLQRRIVELDATISRLVNRLAHIEGSSPDEVRQIYSVSFTEPEKSVAALQDELLEKNNIILNLRFTQESLNLEIDRLQRRIEECIDVGDTGKFVPKSNKFLQEQLLRTQRTQQNQMEAMVATIDNLKVLIEHLQNKNSKLTLQASHMAKYDEALSEMRSLRNRLGIMQDNFQNLLRTSSALAQPTVTSHIDRPPRLRQRLPTARTEAEERHVQLEVFQTSMEDQLPKTSARGDVTKTPPEQQRPFSVPGYKGSVLLPRLSCGIELSKRNSTASIVSELADEDVDGGVPPPLSPAPLVNAFESNVSSRRVDALAASHGDMGHHRKLKKDSVTRRDQI